MDGADIVGSGSIVVGRLCGRLFPIVEIDGNGPQETPDRDGFGRQSRKVLKYRHNLGEERRLRFRSSLVRLESLRSSVPRHARAEEGGDSDTCRSRQGDRNPRMFGHRFLIQQGGRDVVGQRRRQSASSCASLSGFGAEQSFRFVIRHQIILRLIAREDFISRDVLPCGGADLRRLHRSRAVVFRVVVHIWRPVGCAHRSFGDVGR